MTSMDSSVDRETTPSSATYAHFYFQVRKKLHTDQANPKKD